MSEFAKKIIVLVSISAINLIFTVLFVLFSSPTDQDRVARAWALISLNTSSHAYMWEKVGQSEKAGAELLKIKNPANFGIELKLTLGAVYHSLGSISDAYNLFNEILSADPENKDALYWMARIYLDQKDFKPAMAYFRKLWQLDRKSHKALAGLGDIALARSKHVAARQYYRQADRAKPDDESILLGLARIYVVMDDRVHAREIVDRALRLFPENSFFYLIQLYLEEKEGKQSEQFKILQKLCEKNPNAQEIYIKIGEFLRGHGFYRQAVRHYRIYLNQYPRNPAAYLALGLVYLDMGEMEIAREQFKIASENINFSAKAYYYSSLASYKLDEYDEAYDSALRARTLGFKVPLGWLNNIERILHIYPRTKKA